MVLVPAGSAPTSAQMIFDCTCRAVNPSVLAFEFNKSVASKIIVPSVCEISAVVPLIEEVLSDS